MPTKSKYVIALDQIQAKVFDFLKPFGFRKKGRTFNREAAESDIVQVVNFQAGPFPIGDYEIPGLRPNLYGKFTVNMGVVIKELYDLDDHHKPTNFYQEVYCQPRTRLPVLINGVDEWWDLNQDANRLATEIIDGFKSVGFEYFELYSTRAKFCENYGRYKDAPPRAKLDVALVIRHADKKTGEKLFREYFENITTHPGHKEYVRTLAGKLGIEL